MKKHFGGWTELYMFSCIKMALDKRLMWNPREQFLLCFGIVFIDTMYNSMIRYFLTNNLLDIVGSVGTSKVPYIPQMSRTDPVTKEHSWVLPMYHLLRSLREAVPSFTYVLTSQASPLKHSLLCSQSCEIVCLLLLLLLFKPALLCLNLFIDPDEYLLLFPNMYTWFPLGMFKKFSQITFYMRSKGTHFIFLWEGNLRVAVKALQSQFPCQTFSVWFLKHFLGLSYKSTLSNFCFLKASGSKASLSLLQNDAFKQSQASPKRISTVVYFLCTGHIASPGSLGCLPKVPSNRNAIPSECGGGVAGINPFMKIVSALKVEIVNCTILYRVDRYGIY